jgi:hypothetical protein
MTKPKTKISTASKKKDFNQVAFAIGQIATGDAIEPSPVEFKGKAKAGQAGGLKGGNKRAEALTPEQRSEIARKASRARWDKKLQDAD